MRAHWRHVQNGCKVNAPNSFSKHALNCFSWTAYLQSFISWSAGFTHSRGGYQLPAIAPSTISTTQSYPGHLCPLAFWSTNGQHCAATQNNPFFWIPEALYHLSYPALWCSWSCWSGRPTHPGRLLWYSSPARTWSWHLDTTTPGISSRWYSSYPAIYSVPPWLISIIKPYDTKGAHHRQAVLHNLYAFGEPYDALPPFWVQQMNGLQNYRAKELECLNAVSDCTLCSGKSSHGRTLITIVCSIGSWRNECQGYNSIAAIPIVLLVWQLTHSCNHFWNRESRNGTGPLVNGQWTTQWTERSKGQFQRMSRSFIIGSLPMDRVDLKLKVGAITSTFPCFSLGASNSNMEAERSWKLLDCPLSIQSSAAGLAIFRLSGVCAIR